MSCWGQSTRQRTPTRPLMLVDTSNRLLANAIRWRLEPLISDIIGEDQWGFLGGRAILENVVDLEATMQEVALRWNQPTAWLFDMKAALASDEQDFLHNTFRAISIPKGKCEAIKVL